MAELVMILKKVGAIVYKSRWENKLSVKNCKIKKLEKSLKFYLPATKSKI